MKIEITTQAKEAKVWIIKAMLSLREVYDSLALSSSTDIVVLGVDMAERVTCTRREPTVRELQTYRNAAASAELANPQPTPKAFGCSVKRSWIRIE